MKVETLSTTKGQGVQGPLLITPEIFCDERGFFSESWNQRQFDQVIGASTSFVQDNHSRSVRGVLRGLHYQLEPKAQGKLVRCCMGAIFDVAVDLRVSSPSFGHWVGAELNEENRRQLWIPVGFAHGFLALTDPSEVLYKASGYWSRACERSIRWDDPKLAIAWPLASAGVLQPRLAAKDATAPLLEQLIAAGEVMA